MSHINNILNNIDIYEGMSNNYYDAMVEMITHKKEHISFKSNIRFKICRTKWRNSWKHKK
jgi:hypothetical protein